MSYITFTSDKNVYIVYVNNNIYIYIKKIY